VPDGVLTNDGIAARLDTTDEWIVERTGIKERRFGGTTADLATAAGALALAQAKLSPSDIDAVVLATSTPDHLVAPTAARVASNLGISGGAFDLNAACSGFVYALAVVNGLVGSGLNKVLLIGGETMSRIIDPNDRNTAILFGDGAGAVVVETAEGDGDMLGWDLSAEGKDYELLYAPIGGFMVMDGREIFRRAVRLMTDSAHAALASAGRKPKDVDLYVPHQANVRIIDAALKDMEIPADRCVLTLDKYGNTSAASIPLALDDAQRNGRLEPGMLVLLNGFGAGMTTASALLRWGTPGGSR
jgi:3-oxoacyl-[acyl-carrier-protein] synthase-3